MKRQELRVSVLVPTYDELGTTIDRSILNLALRMQEVQNVSWALLIGVNGTDKQEEVAKIERLVTSHQNILQGVQVQVHHYIQAGKENAMNQLARAATTAFSGNASNLHIGTDVKVYRLPKSFRYLIDEFHRPYNENTNPRYLGASVLPYPIELYQKFFDLDPSQYLFYRLLEIDKDPIVRKHIPKTHLRGGLYITGEWTELPTDTPDDYSISRVARYEYGSDAVQLSTRAKGYVIPRQSFSDYFSVRLKRSIPAEVAVQTNHPEWAGLRDAPLSEAEMTQRLDRLKRESPIHFALYKTKKELDALCRSIAMDMQHANVILKEIKEALLESRLSIPDSVDWNSITTIAQKDPKLAAKVIINHYRSIITALAVDQNSINFGPREERYRGMLPLDEK